MRQLAFKNQTVRPLATLKPPLSISPPAFSAPKNAPLVQTKSGCACGGGCPACQEEKDRPQLQTKLGISTPGDQHEQEADRVADQILRMPDPVLEGRTSGSSKVTAVPTANVSETVHRKCDKCDEEEEPETVQRKALPRLGVEASRPQSHVSDALSSAGQLLDHQTRAFFEPRLGYDLSSVRIHTDPAAAESARAVEARAYTLGRDIVFGPSQYAPSTSEGRRLLAHELAHVVQPKDGGSAGVVQRAEVDDRSCHGLTDIGSDIDAEVNRQIAAARTAAGSPIAVPAFLLDVARRLGGVKLQHMSPIEAFIEGLGAGKVIIPSPSLAGTKFSGVGAVNKMYLSQMTGVHVVGGTALVHGVCVGADKFGHFFEEGYIYHSGIPGISGTPPVPEAAGRGLEINVQGLSSTGVYSNADLEANRTGLQFYKDLEASPSSLTFAIGNYITMMWNEQVNPSFYESAVAGVIWSNLLTGSWAGPFTSTGSAGPAPYTLVDLIATVTTVTGAYEWPAGAASSHKGNIKNGVITQRMTAVSGNLPVPGFPSVSADAVSGISIEYDWEEGAASGKGKWESVNEQTLEGTWGYGASRTNGGTWTLKTGAAVGVIPSPPTAPTADRIVNKENTWLVDDPLHWKEAAHRRAELSKGTRVEVLDEGSGESFNQTAEEFRWWKVRASGTEGWVMQTLLGIAP